MLTVEPAELAQALFDDSSDALFLIDRGTLCLIDGNDVALRFSGRDRESLFELRLLEIVHAQHLSNLIALKEALRDNRRLHAPEGYELLSPLGEEAIPVELTLRPLGDSPCVLLQLKDSRGRRMLEERAALAETELSLVLSTVAAAVWCAERSPEFIPSKPTDGLVGWNYRYLSPAVERVTGWPLEYFMEGPHKFAEIIHPDDRVAVLTERAAFLLSPEMFFSMEARLIGQDGRTRWIRSDIQATRDGQGRAIRLDGVVTDINRSKHAELSLRESQHWLTRLLETSSSGILILDLAGRISFVNPAAETLIGRPINDLLDRDWNELTWSAEFDEQPQLVQLGLRTLQSAEQTLLRPDGTAVVLSLSAAPLRDDGGRVTGVVVTLFDLTQRRRDEEAIHRSEERYRRLFERNLAGVCRYTLGGRFVDGNPAFAHIFGYDSPEEMREVSAESTYFDIAARAEKMERLKAQGHLSNLETRRRRKDGSEVWVLENLALIPDNPMPMIEATLIDISERKRAEQTLADEHALLLSLLHSIPDFIFFKDRDGQYRGCNPAFETYSGLREADILHRKTADLFPREMAISLEKEDAQVYATGLPLRLDRVLDTRIGQRFVELVLNPLVDSNNQIIGLLGIGRDITERRRLEEQLRQAGKMEAIGRLAGGVAHDFNNLLTIILGNLTLVRPILADNPNAIEILADSERAAERAAELTHQLLGFARRQPLTVQAFDLNRCVSETLQLLRRTIDPRVTIETRCDPNLWTVEVDNGQMGQVLMNLCLNARDALPEGGRIFIETANATFNEVDPNANLDARVGDFVRLTITDNGPGIPADVLIRIFEPFFTTKPFGKGTGLGLAVVFGIIRQHQGWIDCQSEAGMETRFDIYLPRSNKPVAEAVFTTDSGSDTGSETILLVDDEPMIRELGRAILERQGYRILLAEDGAVAVKMYQQHHKSIDLILLDLSMPNMSGKEALQHFRSVNSEARVLLASGYSPDQFEGGELAGVLGFISKPYKANDLIRAIRSALDHGARPGEVLLHSR